MLRLLLIAAACIALPAQTRAQSFLDKVEHGEAISGGVKIHYAAYGPKDAPAAVLVHGFPDFWYSWRDQMEALARAGFRSYAIDLRGYNRSGQPQAAEDYAMPKLVADVIAVIRATGKPRVTLIGHDWGGAISWQTAFAAPQLLDRLIILNLPHPRGFLRELANNPQQQKNSEYARQFQQPDSHLKLTPEALAAWVKEPEARALYVEAFRRSSLQAMMAYYQVNYPRPPYQEPAGPVERLRVPTLMIHGLEDTALLPAALNNTWEWVEDLTLVTIPGAGHFVQRDAPQKVSNSITMFLRRDQ